VLIIKISYSKRLKNKNTNFSKKYYFLLTLEYLFERSVYRINIRESIFITKGKNMKILIINGSPKKNGTVAKLLKAVRDGVGEDHFCESIELYDHPINICTACMKCRETGECILPKDSAHIIGEKIRMADALIIGTPVHWGNMSSQLKILFDRNVPVFMSERPSGIPQPRQKGKPAVIVTACTTPWPFNFIAAESRGAIKAVKEVLHYGGCSYIGTIVKPGTKTNPEISQSILHKAERTGKKLAMILNKRRGKGLKHETEF
jgi:NAD(P)H-dependent FMN reductase